MVLLLHQRNSSSTNTPEEEVAEETEATEGEDAEAPAKKAPAKKEESWMDNPMVRSAGRTAATMITRSLLGVLGLGGTRRRRTKSLF